VSGLHHVELCPRSLRYYTKLPELFASTQLGQVLMSAFGGKADTLVARNRLDDEATRGAV
jgi:hypothetical protein